MMMKRVVCLVALLGASACSYNNPTIPSGATVTQLILETNAAVPVTTVNLPVNGTQELYVLWIFSNGTTGAGISSTAQYVSSNTAVVQAPSNGSHQSNCSGYYSTCLSIKALAAGNATITVTDPTNAPNLSGKFTVTVGS